MTSMEHNAHRDQLLPFSVEFGQIRSYKLTHRSIFSELSKKRSIGEDEELYVSYFILGTSGVKRQPGKAHKTCRTTKPRRIYI